MSKDLRAGEAGIKEGMQPQRQSAVARSLPERVVNPVVERLPVGSGVGPDEFWGRGRAMASPPVVSKLLKYMTLGDREIARTGDSDVPLLSLDFVHARYRSQALLVDQDRVIWNRVADRQPER